MPPPLSRSYPFSHLVGCFPVAKTEVPNNNDVDGHSETANGTTAPLADDGLALPQDATETLRDPLAEAVSGVLVYLL